MRNKQKNRTVWHYTYSRNIGKILESQRLLPPYLTPGYAAQEAQAVAENALNDGWKTDAKLLLFSQREDWEPASYRGVCDAKTGEVVDLVRLEDYADYGIAVFRVGVGTKHLVPYLRLTEIVKMPPTMKKGLDETAREIGGNPFDWWGTTKPVGMDKWTAIQVWNPESKAWETFREIEVEKVKLPIEVNSTKPKLELQDRAEAS